MGPQWGDKGCEYRPDKCKHKPGDGCEYCCMDCNLDHHWCPACGTVSDHFNGPCSDMCAMQLKGANPAEHRTPDCRHEREDGCTYCCEVCNHDDHRCPGCGEPVTHKEGVCVQCKKDTAGMYVP